jgi:hypothetical protein
MGKKKPMYLPMGARKLVRLRLSLEKINKCIYVGSLAGFEPVGEMASH